MFYCLVLGWVDLWSGCAQILYIYIIRFSNVGGGGEQHVRPPMCESDFMFFQVKFFPLLICFSIGVGGGGGWTTCTAAHVWEWLCVFLSEILSSLLRRRSKIKPHKLLLFIMWNYASFFLFRFFVLLFFFSLWDPFTIPYSYLQSIFWKYYPHNSI